MLKFKKRKNEHQVKLENLKKIIKYDIENGLTNYDIEESKSKYGRNIITEKQKQNPLIKFLKEFTNLFAILLQIGSVLCFIGYGIDNKMVDYFYLGIVLYIVVILTAIFTFYQEAKSESIMNSFKNLLPNKAKVIRNSEFSYISSSELVVGDTVILEQGDRINADIRLISDKLISVDNSILTGEAEPQHRYFDKNNSNILESENMLFLGTTVVEGEGKGIVINVGDNTQMGKIATLTISTEKIDTPINREINYFIKIISSIAILLGIIFLILSLVKKDPIILSLINPIGIIVANVPEGLLATVTIILSLAAKQMSEKKVLVKNLETVESLGSTSVICTDKTGTLTKNKLAVSNFIFNNIIYKSTPILNDKLVYYWNILMEIGIQCNKSRKSKDIDGNNIFLGNPTDIALSEYIYKTRSKLNNEVILEIPFDSIRKYHLIITKKNDKVFYYLKGASDRLLNYCNRIISDDHCKAINSDLIFDLNDNLDKVANLGERVLGFAYKEEDLDSLKDYSKQNLDTLLKDFIFIGLISFQDPPRENVPWAVKECQTAGIKVVMVTGDHPKTALSIAKQTNIINKEYILLEDTNTNLSNDYILNLDNHNRHLLLNNLDIKAILIKGSLIDNLSKEEWINIKNIPQIVFARTSPKQKLQIVKQFQLSKEIVAVTGDGVNDSPALKKADIGIAMGINGSDVAKETADMILLDDNFASIVNGVKEGRRVFENLKKSIAYTLSSNIPEICPFLLFIIVNIPLPLTTVLILFIDLGTDMLPAIGFAWEKPEADVMKLKPRKMGIDRLVDFNLISFSYLQIGIIQAISGIFTYFYVMNDLGLPYHILPGLGNSFGEKDLYCNIEDNSLQKCGYNDALKMVLYKTKEECQIILETSQTAYFISIIIVQIADKIICKTRRLSIFNHYYFHFGDYIGIFSELILGILLTYVPFLNIGLGTQNLKYEYWLIPIPFAIYIFIYDELRKWIIRNINEDSIIYKLLKW